MGIAMLVDLKSQRMEHCKKSQAKQGNLCFLTLMRDSSLVITQKNNYFCHFQKHIKSLFK